MVFKFGLARIMKMVFKFGLARIMKMVFKFGLARILEMVFTSKLAKHIYLLVFKTFVAICFNIIKMARIRKMVCKYKVAKRI